MPAPTTFAEAVSRAPVRTFQWVIVAVCMLVLVSDGIDMQLLGIVAPLVIADFGVDRGTFGVAMSAALVGFGLGAWGGGWLGDLIGRRYTLAIAAFIFALATVAASQADGVWHMAGWRILGGLGFGAAYSNALAMAGEWLPERLRPVVISTLSVGTPIGGAVVGWIGPGLAEAYGWRGAFVIIGVTTLLLVLIILATLRDSPSFLLGRGKKEEAERAAKRLFGEEIELIPERHGTDAEGGASIGVLHRVNLRLNIGVGLAFAACALCAYAILNWATTFLTAAGFTLAQAGQTVAVVGITSMVGSVLAGILTRQFGSRFTMGLISAALVILMTALGFVIETLPAAPTEQDLLLVMILSGVSAAFFSGGIAVMYVVMTFGYPQSCRTAGIGFGIFMSRVGAISASGLGGAVLDFGQGSVIPFFAILAVSAILVGVAVFVIDRHVPSLRASRAAA